MDIDIVASVAIVFVVLAILCCLISIYSGERAGPPGNPVNATLLLCGEVVLALWQQQ